MSRSEIVLCNHWICNAPASWFPGGMTDDETSYIISCLVERGILEWTGIDEDGEPVLKAVKE